MEDFNNNNSNSFANKEDLKQALEKESWIYLVIALIVAIGVFAGLFWYLSRLPEVQIPEKKEESLMEKQLKALDALRKNTEPLTEEETKKQLEELSELKKDTKPLTGEEAEKQLEELNKLK